MVYKHICRSGTIFRSGPVRRLHKPGNARTEHRRAVYVEEEDVLRRPKGAVDRRSGSRRIGTLWDENTMAVPTEQTPLLDETVGRILDTVNSQTESASNMANRGDDLERRTDAAFLRVTPPKTPLWRRVCCCCSNDENG